MQWGHSTFPFSEVVGGEHLMEGPRTKPESLF